MVLYIVDCTSGFFSSINVYFRQTSIKTKASVPKLIIDTNRAKRKQLRRRFNEVTVNNVAQRLNCGNDVDCLPNTLKTVYYNILFVVSIKESSFVYYCQYFYETSISECIYFNKDSSTISV